MTNQPNDPTSHIVIRGYAAERCRIRGISREEVVAVLTSWTTEMPATGGPPTRRARMGTVNGVGIKVVFEPRPDGTIFVVTVHKT